MPSHARVTDKFTARHRFLDYPVIFVCRDDGVIELYHDVDGMEQFAGYLSSQLKVAREVRDLLIEDIARRVRARPVSAESHAWLHALHKGGLI